VSLNNISDFYWKFCNFTKLKSVFYKKNVSRETMTEKNRRQTGDKGGTENKEEKAQATSAREKTQRRIVRKSLARQDIRKAI